MLKVCISTRLLRKYRHWFILFFLQTHDSTLVDVRLSTAREEEKEELMLLWGEVKEQSWVWRQTGSPVFTGAVLEELTSNGAIRAESGAHQMPCVWLSLWGCFMLRRIRGSHWSRNVHVYYSQRRKKKHGKHIIPKRLFLLSKHVFDMPWFNVCFRYELYAVHLLHFLLIKGIWHWVLVLRTLTL